MAYLSTERLSPVACGGVNTDMAYYGLNASRTARQSFQK